MNWANVKMEIDSQILRRAFCPPPPLGRRWVSLVMRPDVEFHQFFFILIVWRLVRERGIFTLLEYDWLNWHHV